jgi:hypothetical protein
MEAEEELLDNFPLEIKNLIPVFDGAPLLGEVPNEVLQSFVLPFLPTPTLALLSQTSVGFAKITVLLRQRSNENRVQYERWEVVLKEMRIADNLRPLEDALKSRGRLFEVLERKMNAASFKTTHIDRLFPLGLISDYISVYNRMANQIRTFQDSMVNWPMQPISFFNDFYRFIVDILALTNRKIKHLIDENINRLIRVEMQPTARHLDFWETIDVDCKCLNNGVVDLNFHPEGLKIATAVGFGSLGRFALIFSDLKGRCKKNSFLSPICERVQLLIRLRFVPFNEDLQQVIAQLGDDLYSD